MNLDDNPRFPRITRSIESFIEDEEGSIPVGKLLTLGTFVLIMGMVLAGEASAKHGSHSSHRSHSSHSSGSGGHESHVSHASHASHDDHGSHNNNHASHANDHASHASSSDTIANDTNSTVETAGASYTNSVGSSVFLDSWSYYPGSDFVDGVYKQGVNYSDGISGGSMKSLDVEMRDGVVHSFCLTGNSAQVGVSKAEALNDCIVESSYLANDGMYRSTFIGDDGATAELFVKVKDGAIISIGVGGDSPEKAEAVAKAFKACLAEADSKFYQNENLIDCKAAVADGSGLPALLNLKLTDGIYNADVQYAQAKATLTLEIRGGAVHSLALENNSATTGLSKGSALWDWMSASGCFSRDGLYASSFIGDDGKEAMYMAKVANGTLEYAFVPGDSCEKATAVATGIVDCLAQAGLK